MGCDIVAKSLRAPVRLIASNSGVEGDVIIEKLLGKPFEVGYNAVRLFWLPLAVRGEHLLLFPAGHGAWQGGSSSVSPQALLLQ